jgi:hypothetical protein
MPHLPTVKIDAASLIPAVIERIATEKWRTL